MPLSKPVAAALALLAASARAAPDVPCQVSQRALQDCAAASASDSAFTCCSELRALRAQGCQSNRLVLAYGDLCDEASTESLPEEIREDDLISLHAVLSSAGRADLAASIFGEDAEGGEPTGDEDGYADAVADAAEETGDGLDADADADADADGSRPSGLLARPFPSSFGRLASIHELSKSLLLAFSSRARDDASRTRAQPAEAEPSSPRDPCAVKGTSLRASLEALKAGCWRAAESRTSGALLEARRGGRRWGGRWAAPLDAEAAARALVRPRGEAGLAAAHGRAGAAFGAAGADGLRARPCVRAAEERTTAGGLPRHRHHQPRAGSSSASSSSASLSLAALEPLGGEQLVVGDLGGLVGGWGGDRPAEVASMAGRLGVLDADLSEALEGKRTHLRAVQQVGEGADAEVDREATVVPPLVLDGEASETQAIAIPSLRRLAAHGGRDHGSHGGRRASLDPQRGGRFARANPGLAASASNQHHAVKVARAARLPGDAVVRAQVEDGGGRKEAIVGASFRSGIPASFEGLLDLGSVGELELAVGRERGIVKRLKRGTDDPSGALEDEAKPQAGAIATKVWRTKNGDLLALAE